MNTEPKPERWGVVPTEELPLRESLPTLRDETRDRLIRYALRQGEAVCDWVAKRSMRYGDEREYPAEMVAATAFAELIMAVCALDLLQWQSGCQNAREAVDWLARVHEMVEHTREWAERIDQGSTESRPTGLEEKA